jgi:hypothetical protein
VTSLLPELVLCQQPNIDLVLPKFFCMCHDQLFISNEFMLQESEIFGCRCDPGLPSDIFAVYDSKLQAK